MCVDLDEFKEIGYKVCQEAKIDIEKLIPRYADLYRLMFSHAAIGHWTTSKSKTGMKKLLNYTTIIIKRRD